MINLFDSRPKTDSSELERVKAMVRKTFGLTDDDVIFVTELACPDADCPDLETIIGVMGPPGKARKHKLMKPVREVTVDDILSLAARGTHG
jgi:hypothetical protein